jgi:hypothetical protein
MTVNMPDGVIDEDAAKLRKIHDYLKNGVRLISGSE